MVSHSLQRSISIAIIVFLLIPTLLQMTLVCAGEGRFVISEDFESYSDGYCPSEFELRGTGAGLSRQVVTEDYSYSGHKSFQMQGGDGSVVSVDRRFSSPGYENLITAQIMSENYTFSQNSGGSFNTNIGIGFSSVDDTKIYGCIWFGDDGNIYFDNGEESITLRAFKAYNWYKCDVYINSTSNRVTAWINDILLGTMDIHPEKQIDCISILAGGSGVTSYIDDLTLYAYTNPFHQSNASNPYPIVMIPIVAVLIGVPAFLLLRETRSFDSLPKKRIKIEEIMKAVGLGSPLLSFGLVLILNHRAFGEQYGDLMITGGVVTIILTLMMVYHIIIRWKHEV
jgi:hypothetical protein